MEANIEASASLIIHIQPDSKKMMHFCVDYWHLPPAKFT